MKSRRSREGKRDREPTLRNNDLRVKEKKIKSLKLNLFEEELE